MTSLILPVASFCFVSYPVKTWLEPKVAPAAVLALVLLLFVADCLLNDMFNPVFPLISGGLSGLMLQEMRAKRDRLKQRSKIKNHRYKDKQNRASKLF